MSITTIKRMMTSIDNGKPINLDLFIKSIQKINMRHRFEISDIESTKIKTKGYRVTHIHPALYEQLSNYANGAGDDRISAARQNDSHRHKVMGSYLLIIADADKSATPEPHPMVVLFDGEGKAKYPSVDLPAIKPARNLLMLENRQLFLHWKKTVAFLKSHCDFDNNDFDIAFGSGNEITNGLHKDFIAKYDTLYFCFDIDLGGLTIAKSLINMASGTAYKFLMPKDINDRLSQVVNQISMDTLNQVRTIGKEYAGLQKAAAAISLHNTTIEQESFLYVQQP